MRAGGDAGEREDAAVSVSAAERSFYFGTAQEQGKCFSWALTFKVERF